MVLDQKTNFFLGKDGFGPKNQLFPRKNQKNQKNHLLENFMAELQKDGFFGFP